ncbi:MAG: hypothetical protein QM715_06135 [Nibricoccus sp.]
MKSPLVLLAAVLMLLLCGCVSTPDPDKLKLGMSKKEVSKIMGAPRSTDTDGEIEYWNYSIKDGATVPLTSATTPPDGSKPSYDAVIFDRYSADPLSRSANKYSPSDPTADNFQSTTTRQGPTTWSRSFPFTIEFSNNRLTGAGSSQVYGLRRFTVDGAIQVLSSTVSSKTHDPTKITLKVRYKFRSKNGGILQLAFNVDGPNSFRVLSTEELNNAEGEIEISATTTPKDWDEASPFRAVVLLREGTLSNKGDVLGTKTHIIRPAKP